MEGEDEKRSVEKEKEVDETEDETLKYHLLGPSLTKAGQDAVDQRKVSREMFVFSLDSTIMLIDEMK